MFDLKNQKPGRSGITTLVFLFLLSSVPMSQASCIESITDRIEAKQVRLEKARSREKKILKIVGISTFTPTALVMGTMAKLIIDGGTIGTAIIVGSSFGVFVGGSAVAAVAVPMVTYNQILRAEIRGMSRTLELLKASTSHDLENPVLDRTIRRLQRKRPDLSTGQILDSLNLANRDLRFCQPESRVAGIRKIERFLLNSEERGDEVPSLMFLD